MNMLLMIIGKGAVSRLTVPLMCIAAFAAPGHLLAQSYPSKPIKLVVPLSVGLPPDITARLLAQKMSENMAQAIVVENRPGAGSTVGALVVAKSAPDGYTLLMGTGASLVLGPALFLNAGYSPSSSFAPVSLVSAQPFIIVVPASLKVDTLQQFITLVKANPGKYNYASPGTGGGPPFMAAELFTRMAGLKMVHVPFGASAKATIALVAGNAHLYIDAVPVFIAQIRAGTLKPLATTAAQRTPFLPDVPTTAEAGVPNLEIGTWGAIVAPAGTPGAIIQRLNQEIVKAAASKEMQEGFTRLMATLQTSTPEELAKHIAAENAKWGKLIADTGIKPN